MWETAEKFWKVLEFVGKYLDMWTMALPHLTSFP